MTCCHDYVDWFMGLDGVLHFYDILIILKYYYIVYLMKLLYRFLFHLISGVSTSGSSKCCIFITTAV
jgi:hypothetical protein